MSEDMSSISKSLAKLQAKTHEQDVELRQALTLEASTRERCILSTQADSNNRMVEARQRFEACMAEMKKETKGDYAQVLVLIDALRVDFSVSSDKSQRVFDARFYELLEALSKNEAEVQRCYNETCGLMQTISSSVDDRFRETDDRFHKEQADTKKALAGLNEQHNEELLEREKEQHMMVELIDMALQRPAVEGKKEDGL